VSELPPEPGAPDTATDAALEAAARARLAVGRDVMVTFGGRLVLTAVLIVTDVILARTLGPEGKGAFVLLLLLAQMAALVIGFGLDRALGVMVARSRGVAQRAFANAAWWTLIVGGLGVVTILLLYGLPAGPEGPRGPLTLIMPPLSERDLVLGALALPGELAFGIGLTGLLGRQRVVAYNVLRLARRLLLLVMLGAFVALGSLDLGLVLVLNLVALAVTAVGIGWAAARSGMLAVRGSVGLLREQLSFGSRTIVGTLAERLHFRADAFLLNILIGVASTGVYSVALALAEMLWYLPSALGLVLFSRAVGRGQDSAGMASTMTRSMLGLSVIAAIPLALIAPTLVELVYGAPFREAGVALQVMLPGVVAYSIVAILAHFIIAWGAPGRATAIMIGGLAINLLANWLLIPAYGMLGAATAATISYSVTAAMTLFVFTRISGRSLAETLIPRPSDITARLAELRTLAGRMTGRGP
jgi:O-antigen/teichoic acid export membrane protein